MEDENQIDIKFISLAEQFLYSMKITYPEFVYFEGAEVSEKFQKQMHDFLYDIICNMYSNPSVFGFSISEDAFCEQQNSTKAKDILNKTKKKFFEFFKLLLEIGYIGEIEGDTFVVSKENTKKVLKSFVQFEACGLECEETENRLVFRNSKYPLLFPGWKGLSSVKRDNITKARQIFNFTLCKYSDNQIYNAVQLFAKPTGSKAILEKLENYFRNSGYECTNGHICDVEVEWEKIYSKKHRSRMKIYFHSERKHQIIFEFKIPDFQNILYNFKKLEEGLKELVFERAGTCKDCGFCVQTDKLNTREIRAVKVEHGGESFFKCPMYPNLNWSYIDENISSNILKLYEFADRIYKY